MPRIPRTYLALGAALLLLIVHRQIRPFSLTSSHSYPSLPTSNTDRPRISSAAKNKNAWQREGYHDEHAGIVVDSKGLTSWTPPSGLGERGRHPIEMLIERGKKLASEMEAKIAKVTHVKDSVHDYEKRFGMRPPRGFETWYLFTHHTSRPYPPPLPSLIPLAHTPFLSFLSFPAGTIHQRVEEVRSKGDIFTFTFVPDGQGDEGTACEADQSWVPADYHGRGRGRVRIQGQGAWKWRCNNTLTLLLPILPVLPEEIYEADPPVELAFSIDDGPRGMVHNTFREKSEALGRAGKVWPQAQLDKAEQSMRWTYGWAWSCPEEAPLKTQSTDLVLNDLHGAYQESNQAQKSFIADFERSADYCSNTDLMGLHHILLSEEHRAAVDMVPVVATCKTMWNSDVVGVPLDGVYEKLEYVPWEQKPLAKIFWRGSATGLSHNKKTRWRSSQRERLHFLAHNTSNTHDLLLSDGSVRVYDHQELADKWLDVGLSGVPVQCDKEDGSCDDMAREIKFLDRVSKEDSLKYKYVLDVDGNGWSSRFRRLLSSNNVVLKSTLYPEWFHEMLIPWYHYVPVKLDYSDIFDIMAFFDGSPDGQVSGREDLAKEIAQHGQEFVETRWRLEDMQSFTYLLILEYWRLWSDDRHAASYVS
ncbi:hypothetical protein IAR55_000406 [Kwoniella newhampshirensis]|uniref:Glycosyl transferase CAP10 domain-containing protein n=1 Tax=Kwoniella newhampshirensis TaxID=1651941 RepID=A0AAW0Z6I2_9TREE